MGLLQNLHFATAPKNILLFLRAIDNRPYEFYRSLSILPYSYRISTHNERQRNRPFRLLAIGIASVGNHQAALIADQQLR